MPRHPVEPGRRTSTSARSWARSKPASRAGLTLSDALRKHPKVFDNLFVNLVQAGEAGGILDSILQRLSIYLEKAMKLKRRVKGAMVYPISVLFIAGIVVTVLLTKVIPVFEKMFKEFGGGKLPKPTQIVIDISHALSTSLPFILSVMAAVFIAVRMALRTAEGAPHLRRDAAQDAGPRARCCARWWWLASRRTMGTLLSSGVPILDAMDIVARTAGNTVVEKGSCMPARRSRRGRTWPTP